MTKNSGTQALTTGKQVLTGRKDTLRGRKLVVATHNAGKLAEFEHLLSPLGVVVVGAAAVGLPSPTELRQAEGGTFVSNSRLKAQAGTQFCGELVLADDSGLCVDVLGGLPGVDTAYYGGYARVLEALEAVTEPVGRKASFTCVLTLAFPDGETFVYEGVCPGTIALAAQGENGFGYDPVFIPAGECRTFAQMEGAEKDSFSHRGRAMAQLLGDW